MEIEDNILGAKKIIIDIKKRAKDIHVAHIISLDKAHTRKKGTTEDHEKKWQRISKRKDMGRAIARVKWKVFKPVTKLYHTTEQGKIECSSQKM